MRLSTDPDRDEERARQTIAAAVAAGVTVFDTAHAYGRDETELGHNERLLARVLRETWMPRGGPDSHPSPRIVTKGGMTRPAGAWIPDGRAKAILADCDASLAALDGLAIDLYLIHAPDPRTPWRTSVRALARLLDQQLVEPGRPVERQPPSSSTRRSSSRRSRPSRSRSASTTTARFEAG